MATGWLRGTVKEVASGDTLVIIGSAKAGPGPEKRVTLSSLVCPKLGKRDGSSKDEPFAWDSREFLRKKAIGQPCVFKIDYTVEAIGNREFGSVFIGQENLALSVAASGWAKVRATGTQQSPYIEDLKQAEATAQSQGLGLWSKDSSALAAAVRDLQVSSDEGFDAQAFFDTVGKGKAVPALVEAVLNGTTFRVSLLPDRQNVSVTLCGVLAPSMGRRAPAAAAEANGENGASAGPKPAPTLADVAAAAAAPEEQKEQKCARDAKFFSELRALNREVRIVLEGVDPKFGNLTGTVFYPEGDTAVNLGEQLVAAGLAKTVEWGLNILSAGAVAGNKLRELERAAKVARKMMWTDYVPPQTNQTKLSDNFTARVIEVQSGDCLVVKDLASGIERRVHLSSIRAPRMATRSSNAEPLASEAREFLRKKLIGREVVVNMEYNRKVQAQSSAEHAAGQDLVLSFGNVELAGAPAASGEEPKNAAEMVVARGLAKVMTHRTDEERSSVYDRLQELQEAASKAKKGVHSSKEAPAPKINDVSAPAAAARAKQYLYNFQKGGRISAVVDYVITGHRLKLFIPKENLCIAFAPSGVKTPQRQVPAQNGRPAHAGEPFADEALAFTREHMMQRDVEIEVNMVDKVGTFLGTIIVPGPKPFNLGLALVKEGLARLQPFYEPERNPGGSELLAAQAAAKAAKLKIWANWTPEQDAVAGADDDVSVAGSSNGGASGAGESVEVVVTEVASASEIYCQMAAEPRVAWLTEQLANVSTANSMREAPSTPNTLCLGRFTLDNAWYRAFIERIHKEEPRFEVFFIDYGNKERLPTDRIAAIDAALAAVPAQAHLCQLAHIKVPDVSSEYSDQAAGFLSEALGGGGRVMARIVNREKQVATGPGRNHPKYSQPKLIAYLTPQDSDSGLSINAEMLELGLARLPALRKIRDPSVKEAVTKLAAHEEIGRKGHRGMFMYGDPGDSDDEPAAPTSFASAAKRK